MPTISPLALQTRDLVLRMVPDLPERDLVSLLVAVAVHRIGRGDVCLPLADLPGKGIAAALVPPDEEPDEEPDEGSAFWEVLDASPDFRFPDEARLAAVLSNAPDVVGGGEADAEGRPLSDRPFVLAGGRLYTRRNYAYECIVRHAVETARNSASDAGGAAADEGDGLNEKQLAAVPVLLGNKLSILTGGPGTGKTYTLARVILRALRKDSGLRFRLAAPTGKAAARMVQSIAGAKGKIREAGGADESLLARLPEEALTLHKLLGINPTTGRPRHGRDNPLDLDWLVVDEASMIGLPLIAHVLDALPAGARLTLIGDSDQLASVERGRVFRDLCAKKGEIPLARLEKSERFQEGGPIDRLARAINGDRDAAGRSVDARLADVRSLFSGGGDPAFPLRWVRHGANSAGPASWPGFDEAVKAGYEAFARSKTPEEAFKVIERFRVLCALRHDRCFGVRAVDAWIDRFLRRTWRNAPKPVLVTANDRALGVNNGDLGVVFPGDPDNVFLQAVPDGPVRKINRWLLPGLEGAWATTIHKSQGSEYDGVAIVLPREADCPILTREILYTAVTRTKGGVSLWASEAAVRQCLERAVSRASGLA